MDTTLTTEQRTAMERDMQTYEQEREVPLMPREQTAYQMGWLDGLKAALQDERNALLARIEAVQRGGAQ